MIGVQQRSEESSACGVSINIQRILLREIMGCNGEGGIIVEKRSVLLCRRFSTTKIQISGYLRATEIGK